MGRMDEKLKRRRRVRFRFSLASLLLFTAAIGAILAVMRLQLFRHANQAAVVAEIMSSYGNGPDDSYDVARVNTKVAPYVGSAGGGISWGGLRFRAPSGWTKTFADFIGLDYTFDVTFVSIGGNSGDPRKLLERAKELPRLNHLTFHSCKNADQYVDLLAEFSQVQTIELLYANVSPSAVEQLRKALPKANIEVKYSYADYFTDK